MTQNPKPQRPKDLRDEFAMAALQGMIAGYNGNLTDKTNNSYMENGCAAAAYGFADAMLKARGEVK
jgi:hypothetical protein